MTRLIHLNGPSRVGKSTLARRYGDDHPGTLVLDLDVLAGLVGGWRLDFFGALNVARGHGRALALEHLRQGHDVVLPQLVTSHDQGPGFDEVAEAAGADYIEVALMVDDESHVRRLREKRPSNEIEARIQAVLEDPNTGLVGRIRLHLDQHLTSRAQAVRLDTTGLDEDETYARLLAVLADEAAATS
jgi:hypothetical protein